MINLHHTDCMEFMRGLPDKAFDLAIVDPPYGIGEDGAKNHSRGSNAKPTMYAAKDWDSARPSVEYFNELRRISKAQIIWGGNYFADMLPPSMGWIVWDKMEAENDFSSCELAYSSFKKGLRKFRFLWSGYWQGDMKNKEVRIHPTQKPVALYRWLLQNYAKPGQKILDTHLGSGSIAIACDIEGFDLDGCELDADYIAAARKRLAQHQAQPRMFDAPKSEQPQQLTI